MLTEDAAHGVLANDTHAASATVNVGQGPQHGALTLNTDGSFSYTPDFRYAGQDSFTYSVTDAGGTSNVGSATLNVAPVNLTIIGNQPGLSFMSGPGNDAIISAGDGGTLQGGGGPVTIDPGPGTWPDVDYVQGGAGPATLELINGNASNYVWEDFTAAKGDSVGLKDFAQGTTPGILDYGNGQYGIGLSDGSWGYIQSSTPITAANFHAIS
jgi:hypothetical protein